MTKANNKSPQKHLVQQLYRLLQRAFSKTVIGSESNKNLAIDFRVTPSPVPQQYIDATLEALKAHKEKTLKNVVIY